MLKNDKCELYLKMMALVEAHLQITTHALYNSFLKSCTRKHVKGLK